MKIESHAKSMALDGSFNNNKMWKLKRDIMPQKMAVPTAKYDQNGILVTNPSSLKRITLDAFVHRLRQRKILPELENLKTLREELFFNRLKECKANKSPDFTTKQLDEVLKTNKMKKFSKIQLFFAIVVQNSLSLMKCFRNFSIFCVKHQNLSDNHYQIS